MCDVVTYHSVNAKPHQQWIGYAVLPDGNQWGVRFEGRAELEVIDRARAFYAKEKARQDRLFPGAAVEAQQEKESPEGPGRGHAASGTVWLLNRKTQARARVAPDQVAECLAKGYVRAGPKTS